MLIDDDRENADTIAHEMGKHHLCPNPNPNPSPDPNHNPNPNPNPNPNLNPLTLTSTLTLTLTFKPYILHPTPSPPTLCVCVCVCGVLARVRTVQDTTTGLTTRVAVCAWAVAPTLGSARNRTTGGSKRRITTLACFDSPNVSSMDSFLFVGGQQQQQQQPNLPLRLDYIYSL
jgi:hypothetical protein